MTGILVTRVNSDESAQSARCARLPRHMLSHHVFIFVIEHQRAGLACESRTQLSRVAQKQSTLGKELGEILVLF